MAPDLEKVKIINMFSTGFSFSLWQVVLPTCELVLSPRDDMAEIDDSIDQQQNFKDDPRYILLLADLLCLFVLYSVQCSGLLLVQILSEIPARVLFLSKTIICNYI